MQTALITTTINVPKVLALYRKLGPDVKFFVAGDYKTPLEAYEFCADIPDCEIYSPDRQKELDYKCSALIGWDCIQRRNIALLEAIKWGADVIYTWDDDNVLLGEFSAKLYALWQVDVPSTTPRYYWGQRSGNADVIGAPYFSGLKASAPSGWFDPGCLLSPQTKHRGFPISIKPEFSFESVTDAKIGVAAGLCLGDPDIDAVTRIATAPIIHSVSQLGEAGVVTDPRETKTVFNSQNTSFIRQLAPAMFMMPFCGRYDDIYASLICQRIMREHGLHVHFGKPYVWQQRNQHNLLNDLRIEIDGMERIERFADFLDACIMPSLSDTENLRWIYRSLGEPGMLPPEASVAALAFLDDIEPLL